MNEETTEKIEDIESNPIDSTIEDTQETLEDIQKVIEEQNSLMESEQESKVDEEDLKQVEQEELEEFQKQLLDGFDTLDDSLSSLKMSKADQEKQEEFHEQLLDGFDTLDSSLSTLSESVTPDNTDILASLEEVNGNLLQVTELLTNLNEVGHTFGMYALIIVPGAVVIWILYKLISMWIRPFI